MCCSIVGVQLGHAAILDERKEIDNVEVSTLSVDQDAIPRLAAWAQPPVGEANLRFQRIKINTVKLALRGIEVPAFEALITIGKDGGWQKAVLKDAKFSVELLPIKEQGVLRANFSARNWQSPVGPKFEFADLTGTATLGRQQVVLSNLEGRLFGGALKGAATIKWDANISAEGDLALKGADLGLVLAGYTRDFTASGALETNMKFAAQGSTPDELFAAPRVTATFMLQKGTLNNIDLVRAIQAAGRGGQRGGKTAYAELSGEAQAAGNRIAFRNLKLVAGPLNASGNVDVSPAAELAGRLSVQFGTQSVAVARGTLTVGGAIKDPLLSSP